MFRFTFRQLEYFLAVGTAGSIAGAARQLGITSPSISIAITQLEKALGLPLFQRQHAHGLSLTPEGRRMMEQARRVLMQAGRLSDLAGDISGALQGRLRVGCLLSFAQVISPDLRRGFQQAYPGVHLLQRELNQAEIYSLLRRSEIDVALTYDMDLPGDLGFAPLLALPPYAMVGAAHPLAGRAQVSVRDLLAHPMVLLDLPFSSAYFLSFFESLGVQPEIAERSRDMEVVRGLVANGFGYAIANVPPLNDRAPDGKPLHFIPLAGDVRRIRMGLLTTRTTDPLAQAFVEHCRAQAQSGAFPGVGDAPPGLAPAPIRPG